MESTKRTKDQGNLDVSNQGGTGTSPANQKELQPSGTGEQKDKQNLQAGHAQQYETINQAKQAVTGAYNRASQELSATYKQAMDYGRDNPGKLTLIAFGAGIGVGILLAGGVGSSRNRTDRIVPPVMNALSAIAAEIFR